MKKKATYEDFEKMIKILEEHKVTKPYYIENKEKILEQSKKRYINNSEEMKKRNNKYYKNNRKKIKEKHKEWNKNNIIKRKKYLKQWHKDNPEYNKQWRENNPEKVREQKKRYYKRFNLSLKMSRAISRSLKGNKGGKHWKTLIGYTLNDLTKHLKSTLLKGYTWKDFLEGKLHIDHIIPVRAFVFKNSEDEEFKQCWSLENLRLLLAKDNMSKQEKINNSILLGLLIKGSELK